MVCRAWIGVWLAALLWACGDDSGLPEPYRSLAVPTERLRSEQARRNGRILFRANCVICHGERADGRGPRHATLLPPPRDYRDPAWRSQATPRSVYFALAEGIQGTAMPAWDVFEPEQLWDITAYVLSVAEQGAMVLGIDEGLAGDEN